MARLIFPKKSNTQITPHFKAYEFDCSCNNPECTITIIDEDLVKKLELVRVKRGQPIRIHSGFRCAKHNKKENGSPKSQHLEGKAVDIDYTNDIEYDYLKTLFRGIGDGRKKGFIHVDIRPTPASWTY